MTHNASSHQSSRSSRRRVVKAAGMGSIAAWTGLPGIGLTAAQTPVAAVALDEMVIDLSGAPESIDPALAYSARDWSIVHSVYDSPVGFAADGSIQPLAAESFQWVDELTCEIVLRSGLVFHDGSPVTSAAISRSVAYLKDSGSSASSLFTGIAEVVEVDELTVHLKLDSPSPWLPSQIAVWLLLLPESFTPDAAISTPVGSGPYRFESQEAGSSITLVRNPGYTWGSPKGHALAERVTYRFVPESATRIADISTGQSHVVAEIPSDQLATIEESGAIAIEAPIVGSAWIRIATDAAPFDNALVRRAVNHAIDVQAIAEALVSPKSGRLASLFPDARSLGFNEDLTPYAYDPDRAKALLAEADLANGFATELEITTAARVDVAEAIAAQLGEVGIEVTIKTSEYTEFNANWAEPSAPALRMVTWSPLYDPHTLLSLVFASDGFLSRYANADADALIADAAAEPDPDKRAAMYSDLAALMYEDAPAIFLWNLTIGYGVAQDAAAWQPRGDEYVIATAVDEQA